jgi:hypothetical protein
MMVAAFKQPSCTAGLGTHDRYVEAARVLTTLVRSLPDFPGESAVSAARIGLLPLVVASVPQPRSSRFVPVNQIVRASADARDLDDSVVRCDRAGRAGAGDCIRGIGIAGTTRALWWKRSCQGTA